MNEIKNKDNITVGMEKNRPRRLEANTLAYLKQVQDILRNNESEKDDTIEDPELILWNVLDELTSCSASASSDRHGCELIEFFLGRFSKKQLRRFLSGFEGYYIHLWTNRYSSHVLQRILSQIGPEIASEYENGTSEVEIDPEHGEIPSMISIIDTMCKELHGQWVDCSFDISASHVLRSLLCVLSGKQIPKEKRGKKGKHRAVQFISSTSSLTETMITPPAFTNVLDEIISQFLKLSSSELQEVAFDVHGGPVLSLLFRLSLKKHHRVFLDILLQLKDKSSCKEAFYQYSGDRVASHFLEAVFECCHNELSEEIYSQCLAGSLMDYTEHSVSNYVVQSFLLNCKLPKVLSKVISEVKPSLWKFFSMGRPGIVYHLIEACVRLNTFKEEIVELVIQAIAKSEESKPENMRKDIVASLLSLQLPNEKNNQLWMDVMGAKIVCLLLQCEVEGSQHVLKRNFMVNSLFLMSKEELLALAKNNLGSRCIEAVWEGGQTVLWAKEKLFDLYHESFGMLASDTCGVFTVMKAYECVSVNQKMQIVKELVPIESKLSGLRFGPLVLKTCHVTEYKTNPDRWKQMHMKQNKANDYFQDLLTDQEVDKLEIGKEQKKEKKNKREKKEKNKKKKQKKEKGVGDIVNVLLGQQKEIEKRKVGFLEESSSLDYSFVMDALMNNESEVSTENLSSRKSKKFKKN